MNFRFKIVWGDYHPAKGDTCYIHDSKTSKTISSIRAQTKSDLEELLNLLNSLDQLAKSNPLYIKDEKDYGQNR